MWFGTDLHRSNASGPRSRLAGAMLAVVFVFTTLTSPAPAQAQDALIHPLPPMAPMLPLTASSALAPDLLLITATDLAPQPSPVASASNADGSLGVPAILGGFGGGIVALGLLVLAGVNSRKRWPVFVTLKNA
ncbi:MAG: hypothetical protein JJT88_12285 [Gammaproteobacteria bacterium]|nr:hypothetical protein [Gammaproteobacteria bacterium]